MMTRFLALALLVLITAPARAQSELPQASQRPPCEAAADDQYGYARDRAIQVGGSPMFGAARQRRYLDTLRGPEGQAVKYKRLGQDRAPDGTVLDAYERHWRSGAPSRCGSTEYRSRLASCCRSASARCERVRIGW